MRIWPRKTSPRVAHDSPETPLTTAPPAEAPPEPTTEQVLEAGPALDWGGDPSRITG